MTAQFPPERFNERSAAQAFRSLAAHQDFDVVRWALLARYAEDRQLLSSTDPNAINRGIGKAEEIEWVLAQFGEHPYGGLPLADGTSGVGDAAAEDALGAEIGGGYPGGSGSRPPL